MVNQKKAVYRSEWAMPKTFDIMPDVRKFNSNNLEKKVLRKRTFIIGANGVIEKVVFDNGEFIEPSDGISRDSWGFPKMEYIIDEKLEYKFNQYDYHFNDYKNPPPAPKFEKDLEIFETFWKLAEKYSKLYPNEQGYEWHMYMGCMTPRRRRYFDKAGNQYYANTYELNLEISKPILENNETWNEKLLKNKYAYKNVKNENKLSTEELEKIVRKNVKTKIFSDFFYKKYFDKNINIELVNSYEGSSYYTWGGRIILKKWATDLTLLHELAHQGAGCNNDHDEYFTSQLLMLVGRFLGHEMQIKLIEEYKLRDVHWLGIFNHTEQCLKDCGVTNEVMLKGAKSVKQCATGTTRMVARFNNHLTKKVASARY
jgi:hypothetical protein